VRAAGVAVAVAAALAATGCCRIFDDTWDHSVAPDPAPNAPALELGTAVYPADTPAAGATRHTWIAPRLRPTTYRVGYALSATEQASVDGSFRVWSKLVGYQPEGSTKFRWIPPPGCGGDMHCVYENLAGRSREDLAPVVERFRRRVREARLSSLEAASLVVTWVQSIKYEIPTGEPFGVLPPALVVSLRKGDCDSKSLLAHMILHDLGVDSVMVSSTAHRHGMVGIALPVQGTTFSWSGRRYAFTEVTAKGSPIGHINPSLLRPNDWRAIPITIPSTPAPDPAPAKTAPRPTRPSPRPKGR
jgi:hypothetical protein